MGKTNKTKSTRSFKKENETLRSKKAKNDPHAGLNEKK